MTSDLDYFQKVYFEECTELMESGEATLIKLSKQEDFAEFQDDINSLFRCIHSIKGGGGTFGFTVLINFAHQYETLLDRVRNGHTPLSKEIISLMLQAHDVLDDLLEDAQEGRTDNVPSDYNNVLEELKKASGKSGTEKVNTEKTLSTEKGHKPSNNGEWKTLRFVPHPNIMNLGNDPVLLLKELERVIYQNLNENKEQLKIKISATTDRVPTLDSYSPEECYLEWQIKYPESVADETILDVFEFVENDCNLFITYEDNAGTMSDDHEHDDPSQLHQENSGLQTNNDPTKKTDNREAQIQSIRVDIDRIDKIVNMVGEMVIKQAMVIDQANIFENELGSSNKSIVDELMKGIQDLTQHTRDLQETVMAIRAQPVKTVFSRLPRLVREVSHELNKEIRLETQGENTEIDKTVIERLGEPLTHLVRNAVDHGIETPEEREAQNKPREGLLVISAGHRSGRIVIEIKDDGRGINRERVLQKAKEKGLVPTDANPTEEEIDQMIFMPGFSTAATVSNISGRGVGMDVVRKTIQGIGGRISIQSELNKGTTFTLTLPLTLAVLDGMLVSVGQECMIIPLINILETIRPSLEQIRPIMDGSHILRLRNEIIPIIYLYQVFNIEDAITDVSEAILVVVETEGGDKVGIVVDQMIGQQQAVIKSLETNYESINGISGATILGNGRVSLILDVSALRFLNKKMFKSQNVSKSTPLGSEDRPHDYTNV